MVFEAVDALYHHLKKEGDVYKFQRPDNSEKEDIVINVVYYGADTVNEGILNINCFVPDITVSLKGKPSRMPDTKRLSEVSMSMYTLLKDKIKIDDYYFWIESQGIYKDEKSYFVNNRINFKKL
jgi:hypothetical protein